MIVLGPQSIGSDRDYVLGPIKDAHGDLVPFAGTEPVSVRVWRPDGIRTAPLVSRAGSWRDAPGGLVLVTIAAADVAALAPGDYALEVVVTAGGRPLDVLGPADAVLRLADSPRAARVPSGVPTVATVEDRLLRRFRGLLDLAGMDAATNNGRNLDLAGPIADALLESGSPPADLGAPADADMAAIPPGQVGAFLALCRIKAGEAILDQLRARIDIEVGIDRWSFSQAAAGMEKTLTRLRSEYIEQFLIGGGRCESAPIDSTDRAPVPGTWPWGEGSRTWP